MEFVRTDQIVALVLFLGLLAALWLIVRRYKGALSGRLGQGRRVRVVEVTALSPADRAMILDVDGREFLLLRLRGAAPLLQELGPRAGAPEAGA